MAHDLPTQFDVIVVGTGMPECVLAAAYARIGHSVLHIDRNDYYSADWASFNLDGIDRWASSQQTSDDKYTDCLQRPENEEQVLLSGEKLVQCPLRSRTFRDINIKYHIKDKPAVEQEVINDHAESITNKLSHDLSVSDTTGSSSSRIDSEIGTNVTDSSVAVQEREEQENAITAHETSVIGDNVCDVAITGGGASPGRSKEHDSATGVSESAECCAGESTQSAAGNESVPRDVKREPDAAGDLAPKEWTRERIKKEWRKFNIDLIPKLLFSRGELVELLISSDVAKYCEFKTVTRVLTLLHGRLEQVPCSRSDVFSNKLVSVIEKRMLMKFITFCLKYQNQTQEYQEFTDRPFNEFLRSRKLTPNLQHFVQHAIAMATDGTTTAEGLVKTHKFLTSLGRYGNTAFLWPLYGSGELPQAFARLCAVFGGIYCLRMSASSLIVDGENNRCKGIVTTGGQRIEAKHVILESSYVPECYKQSQDTKVRQCIARAVVLIDRSIKGDDQNQVSLLHLPCEDDSERPITVLELCSATMACPDDMFMVHLSRVSTGGPPEQELDFAFQQLFERLEVPGESGDASTSRSGPDSKPCILWSLYFTMENTRDRSYCPDIPESLVIVPGPGAELHFDDVTKQSQDIFQSLCPDEEFLPKAPSPEELILFGEDAATNPGFNTEPEDGNTDTTTEGSSDSPEAGSITDPAVSSDLPTEGSKMLAEVSETPAEVSETPADVSETPVDCAEKAAEGSKTPAQSSEIPADDILSVEGSSKNAGQ